MKTFIQVFNFCATLLWHKTKKKNASTRLFFEHCLVSLFKFILPLIGCTINYYSIPISLGGPSSLKHCCTNSHCINSALKNITIVDSWAKCLPHTINKYPCYHTISSLDTGLKLSLSTLYHSWTASPVFEFLRNCINHN